MQLRTTFLAVWSLVAALAAGVAPRLAAQTGKVVCESRGGSREQCVIERGARVELTKHLSDTPCRENSNWGVGQGFIWVSGGCRGEFTVTKVAVPSPVQGPGNATANPNQLRACRTEADRRLAAYSYDQIQVEPDARRGEIAYVRWRAGATGGLCTVAANGRIIEFTMKGEGGGAGGAVGTTTRITCESKSIAREECKIPQGAQIRLVRQLSENPCRLNDTYGTGAGYLWVAKGCRGEFDVTQPAPVPVPTPVPTPVPSGIPGGKPGKTTTVVCRSAEFSQRACPIPAGATARLVKQITDVPCRLDQTYGVGSAFIWVSQGCGGVFEVTERGATGAGTGPVDRVTCESKAGERTECRIRTGGQVRLLRQLSSAACTTNSTWGTGAGVIWVTKGCRAEFEVR